jgi:hexosaminidase
MLLGSKGVWGGRGGGDIAAQQQQGVGSAGGVGGGKDVLHRLRGLVKRLESSLTRQDRPRARVRGLRGRRLVRRGSKVVSGATRHQPSLVPRPASYVHGDKTVLLSPSFSVAPPAHALWNADLKEAIKRYMVIMRPRKAMGRVLPLGGHDCMLRHVRVLVSDAAMTVGAGMDESYSLSIPSAAVCKRGGLVGVLRAKTTVGALRGLETLSQLVAFDADAKAYHIKGVPCKIADAPRFPHRELLIDSARHWLPVATIKALVAALAYVKINVLHWHMTDSQAFPLETSSAPRLASEGAYSSQERYTAEDIAEVAEFARLHGVRLVPEVDTPAHAVSLSLSLRPPQ